MAGESLFLMVTPSRTSWTLAALSALTVIVQSVATPLTMYTPSSVIEISWPSETVSCFALDVSAVCSKSRSVNMLPVSNALSPVVVIGSLVHDPADATEADAGGMPADGEADDSEVAACAQPPNVPTAKTPLSNKVIPILFISTLPSEMTIMSLDAWYSPNLNPT